MNPKLQALITFVFFITFVPVILLWNRDSSLRFGRLVDTHDGSTMNQKNVNNDMKHNSNDDEHNQQQNKNDEEKVITKYDITFLLAIININRTAHAGKEGKAYKFEEDYLPKLNQLVDQLAPYPTRIIVQKKYAEYVTPHLHENSELKHVEIEDLRNFSFFDRIEKIRNTQEWLDATPWLISVPQGYSPYYNPIVMQKLIWLYQLSKENPFGTKYFVWLDSGTCSLSIGLFGREHFIRKLRYHMDRFFMTKSPYRDGADIHGCLKDKMIQLAGEMPDHVNKGWVFGATHHYLSLLYNEYVSMLNTSLSIGCLGTEETIFTILYYTHRHLYHVYDNGDNANEWDDNMCKFVVDNGPYREQLDYCSCSQT